MKKYPKSLKHRLRKYRIKKRNARLRQNKISREKEREKEREERFKRLSTHKEIKSPSILSLIEEPEGVVRFINEIEDCLAQRQPIFVDVSETTNISYDGILILLSLLVQFNENKIDFSGNFPKNEILKNKFKNSGFLNVLEKHSSSIHTINKFYDNNKNIITKAGFNVNAEEKAKIIKTITKNIFGSEQKSQGLNSTIGELMLNTHEHATSISDKSDKPWWVSINFDKSKKSYHVTFLDYGVGILESLNNKPSNHKFKKVMSNLITKKIKIDDKDKLAHMFDFNKIDTISRTGESYKGEGLPSFNENLSKNYYSNLNVISNKVQGDIENNQFKVLNCNFSGTMITFKVDKNNIYDEK